MTADSRALRELSDQLWKRGLGGFCATTLSAPEKELEDAVRRLGNWIRSGRHPGSIPMGIHLEGPFIHPGACGAHPDHSIRTLALNELERLWEASQGTLKILTLAPEQLPPKTLRLVVAWAKRNGVVLSLGHSKATHSEAAWAFKAGFKGVTHAWNALPFHHRDPGALGAALGRKGVHVEIILDQVHVAPDVVRWTRALHPKGLCYVSDCVPAAATRAGTWHRFGALRTRFEKGACRLPGGALAGGGILLPDAFSRWVKDEAKRTGISVTRILSEQIGHVTSEPLRAMGFRESSLKGRKLSWRVSSTGNVEFATRA